MIINKDWDTLTNRDRRKLRAYILFLLRLQKLPLLHDVIRRLGDWVFYKL